MNGFLFTSIGSSNWNGLDVLSTSNRNRLFCGNVRSTRLHPEGCSRKQPVLYVKVWTHVVCQCTVVRLSSMLFVSGLPMAHMAFHNITRSAMWYWLQCFVSPHWARQRASVVRSAASSPAILIFFQGTFGNTRGVVVTLWLCADPAPLRPQLTLQRRPTNQPSNQQRSNWGRRLALKSKSTSFGLLSHSCGDRTAGLNNSHLKL